MSVCVHLYVCELLYLSLVPSPTPSFSSLLSTVPYYVCSDEKLGVGLGTRLVIPASYLHVGGVDHAFMNT